MNEKKHHEKLKRSSSLKHEEVRNTIVHNRVRNTHRKNRGITLKNIPKSLKEKWKHNTQLTNKVLNIILFKHWWLWWPYIKKKWITSLNEHCIPIRTTLIFLINSIKESKDIEKKSHIVKHEIVWKLECQESCKRCKGTVWSRQDKELGPIRWLDQMPRNTKYIHEPGLTKVQYVANYSLYPMKYKIQKTNYNY